MQAYTSRPPVDKPEDPFTLTPYELPVRKHLDEWVTAALLGIRPWVRTFPDRFHRLWKRNPAHTTGAHSAERFKRESQCRRDVERIRQTHYFMECVYHSPKQRAAYRAVIAQVHRLLDAGDWWKPRHLVDARTGEVYETVYLPEDTWSAQTALAWCVALLVRLLASVSRTAERATPHFRPRETVNPSRGGASASEEVDGLGWLARMTEKLWGVQPDLPAMG